MPSPRLTLYVDIVSPFAYLAFHVIRTSPVFKPCEITCIPVLLGAIMKACGNTPPINIKNKSKFINQERLRWARLFDVPMRKSMPPGFPKNTLPTERALTAVYMFYPEKMQETLAAFYHASFAEHQDVVDKDIMYSLLEQVLGQDRAETMLAKSISDEVKKTLAANTDRAMAEGSFGLPWYVATNATGQTECYWGFDHIGQVADHLGLDRPTASKKGGWTAML